MREGSMEGKERGDIGGNWRKGSQSLREPPLPNVFTKDVWRK